jgi:hypothetical protein
MEKKDEIGYFSIEFGIYPRVLYIIKGNDKNKIISDNFMSREETDLEVIDHDRSDGSRTWSVIERNSKKWGFLVQLKRVTDKSEMSHEATHVAFELFKDIGAYADEENQEPFAYLVGWVTRQLINAYNYKEKKMSNDSDN